MPKTVLKVCKDCGEEKEGTVGQMLDWSWDKLKAELDKCDLMCFNCHMELQGEERDLIE